MLAIHMYACIHVGCSRSCRTYVLVNVLLAGVEGRLAHLQAQLGAGVVDEVPKGRVLAEPAGLLLGHAAALRAVAIAALGL